MDNNERMTTWCRMWNEDPTLARDLMTDDCVQWFGQADALDGVVGPEAAIAFMTAYREQQINIFTPRLIVDGGDTLAYLWDVRHPDGTVHTGLDVNILRNEAVAENWTFVSGSRDDRPIPEPAPAGEAELLALAMDALTARGRTLHRVPVIDTARGRIAVLSTDGTDDGTTHGTGAVDLFAVRDGQIAQSWSLAAARPFAY